MNTLQTDMTSLTALNQMRVNQRLKIKSIEQLSSGKAIQSAADNAAGLKTSNLLRAQEKSLVAAIQNVHSGISLAQTADAALSSVTDALQRMREIAVESSNGTLSDTQRGMLDKEYQDLMNQVLRVVQDTQWNGVQWLAIGDQDHQYQRQLQICVCLGNL